MEETEIIDGKVYIRRQDGRIMILEDPEDVEMFKHFPIWFEDFND
ncbi:hypothetical protein [Lentilactobacillus rapi]|uniref:Uncharacterized protein n=1 Tax=Lentilactobacillus rapi TaxID=481723 RepID=A0A512PLI3_9LACO|nr:hypothetical protein [Lentilactobacillus rapi]GEP72057.1 hypothetical protein LRA02_09250 [Lentilactobacillus rapi]